LCPAYSNQCRIAFVVTCSRWFLVGFQMHLRIVERDLCTPGRWHRDSGSTHLLRLHGEGHCGGTPSLPWTTESRRSSRHRIHGPISQVYESASHRAFRSTRSISIDRFLNVSSQLRIQADRMPWSVARESLCSIWFTTRQPLGQAQTVSKSIRYMERPANGR
jgi:hypothetical protein